MRSRPVSELIADTPPEERASPAGLSPMQRLLSAVAAVSSNLELEVTLRQIVHTAMQLVGARYGALGVMDEEGHLRRFIHAGIDDDVATRIGPLPTGHGVLGVVIEESTPLRLDRLADHPSSVGFPEHHPTMDTFLGVPIRVRGATYGRIYLTEKPGGFTDDDEIVMQALAGAAGIAVENARLYDDARRQQSWLEAATTITTELLTSQDPSGALILIAQRARELSDADYAVIALPDPLAADPHDVDALIVTVCVGLDPDTLTGSAVPLADSTAGAVFRDQVPRNVDRLAFDLTARFGPAVAAPLGAAEGILGVLMAVRTAGAPRFTDEELQMVSSFADQGALALRRADELATRQELEVIADRDRIARDLHDQVIQRLFAVGLAMQGTHRRSKAADVSGRLSDHIDQLQRVIQDIRSAIFDLQAPVGAPRPLAEILRAVLAEVTDDVDIRTSLVTAGVLSTVPPDLRRAAEAVIREAVSNVVRHSGATTVAVSVAVGVELILEIADDGTGIPEGAHRSGLSNLVTRAHDAAGRCDIRSGPAGTTVHWSAPLDPVGSRSAS